MLIFASNSLAPVLKGLASIADIEAALTVVAFAPMFGVLVLLFREKRRYLAHADEPFTELPLRPPGESLRLEIERLTDQSETHFFQLALIGAFATCLLIKLPLRWQYVVPVALVTLVAYSIAGRAIIRVVGELWRYRLAYMGERVVGEELNQLLAHGFRVFHDIPFDSFNVDHVIVGPPGVFIVETKTRRKPSDIKGQARATVVFDGARLEFPKWTETAAVEQARRNARTVEQWLTKATGEPVSANAILTYPGWWVERKAVSDVNVLNPAEIKHSFREPKRPLSPEQIQRIAHQLTERCRLTKTQTKK